MPKETRPPQAFLDDGQAQAWLAEPLRLDGREVLFYHGWEQVGGSTGHTVQRLQADQRWGPKFVVTRAFMVRTTAAGILAEGVTPPC